MEIARDREMERERQGRRRGDHSQAINEYINKVT